MDKQITLTKKDFVEEIHSEMVEAVSIFTTKLFESKTYSTFCTLHKDLESNEMDHSCLGCNLNDITIYARTQLEQAISMDNVNGMYMQIIIGLYLVVERIDTILNLIKLDEEYRDENFKTLRKIRKWTNFIKHPKSFILVHHPVATYEGCKFNSGLLKNYKVKIGESFIAKYYSNNDKNEELLKTLQKNESVIIIYPNITKLISGFVDEMHLFNKTIRENKIYRDKLTTMTTFNDYWIDGKENSIEQ